MNTGDNGLMLGSPTLVGIMSTGAGWFMWTLTEYLMHRWSFHHRNDGPLRRLVASEHTRHHREPNRTHLMLRLLGHAGVTGAGLLFGLLLAIVTSQLVGLWVWVGWASGYVIYETTHWRIHHRAPTSRAATRRRHHHLAHHSLNASSNFGVTVRWWDHVFGTSVEPDAVVVPPSHAPCWLVQNPDGHENFAVGRGSQQVPS